MCQEERYKQNICELVDVLIEDNWRIRIEKRGGYFFFFLKYWVMYVQRIPSMKANIPWNDILGYECLVRAFVGEMDRRKVSEYPDIMVDTMTKLASNEVLVGYFMRILFNKTCIFDSDDTFKTIEIVTRLFN